MNILFLGKPGSGKGSISKRLEGEYVYLSTGDLLREEVSKGTPEGIIIGELLKQGKFATDDTIFKIVEKFLAENADKNVIFDGFPRNLKQAQECLNRGINFDVIFSIDVPDEAIEERVVHRRIHPASGRVYNIKTLPPKKDGVDDITGEPLIQRDDDKPEVVSSRLQTYHEITAPITPLLKDNGYTINHIDGNQPLLEQIEIVSNFINQNKPSKKIKPN